MSKLKKIASFVIATAFISTAATAADTFKKYGEVEGWTVYTDIEKKSCLIEAVDAAENVVQMGLTADRGVAYVGVFVKGKTKIKKGAKEAVVISLDGTLYFGEATGMRGNITKGYSGGYVLSDDPQFVDDIARKYVMTVFPEKDYAFQVDLKGTYKAIEMARECNKEAMG
ncbi:MAG: hypothetical protein JKY94_15200 [Rhodobacteraceae bacterium]|nr:hypothetical protein [Paracoccaceae bacterium]